MGFFSFSRGVSSAIVLAGFCSFSVTGLQAGPQPNPGIQFQIPPGEYSALVEIRNFYGAPLEALGWTHPDAPSWGGVYIDGFSSDENGNVTSTGNVVGLSLAGLNLTGEITYWLFAFERLQSLDLRRNRLSGRIPGGVSFLSNLSHLLISSNNLTGWLPSDIGNLPAVEFIDLSHNQLSGPIPESIGNLQRVQELKLEHNNFSGELPASLATAGNLRYIELQDNYFATNSTSGNVELIEQLRTAGAAVTFHPQGELIKIEYSFSSSPAELTLKFKGISGKTYKVEKSSDLQQWDPHIEVPSVGGETSITVPISDAFRFFRLGGN